METIERNVCHESLRGRKRFTIYRLCRASYSAFYLCWVTDKISLRIEPLELYVRFPMKVEEVEVVSISKALPSTAYDSLPTCHWKECSFSLQNLLD